MLEDDALPVKCFKNATKYEMLSFSLVSSVTILFNEIAVIEGIAFQVRFRCSELQITHRVLFFLPWKS